MELKWKSNGSILPRLDWKTSLFPPVNDKCDSCTRLSNRLGYRSVEKRLRFLASSVPGVGRGGLVVRPRLWGRRAPGSKPDSTEDPPCMGPVAR
ncbi:hypothetical protein AVEN_182151-1 [Araneus ventricosus]|uniref:Uncharacterized protein n=1 Tax=Araneus ventricosus TaxID=182803 RepID=A0A4Y2GNE6_ARAVE|nr:hypothetical protein AVEN_182151-1 [Araneus ventricosus]